MSAISAAIGGLATGIGGAAVGSLLGGGGGGGGGGPQVIRTEAPEYAQPSYEFGVDELKRLQEAGKLGEVAELTDYSRGLIEAGKQRALAGSPFFGGATTATQQLLGGAQQLLDPSIQAYQQLQQMPSAVSQLQPQMAGLLAPTQEKIISQFARGGRLGSGAMGEAFGRGATTALAPYLQAAQGQDVQRQLDVARGLGAIGETGIRGLTAGLEAAPVVERMPYTTEGIGLSLEDLLQQQALAESQQEVAGLKEYTNILGALTVGDTQTQPLYGASSPSFGQMALAGAMPQISQAFGTAATDWYKGLGSVQPSTQRPTFNTGTGASVVVNPLPPLP